MERGRAALRLPLLVLVVLGIGWMHTIGHEGHVSGHGGGHEAAAVVHEVMDGPVAAPASPASPDVEMCLAVLAAAVLLAAALLAVRVRREDPRSRPRGAARHLGRGPPRLVPPSLIYADLTVLRI